MTHPENTPWFRSPLVWIMGGLAAWGTYLAVGSFLYGGPMALVRAVLILGCTALFLVVWMAVLSLRKRRQDNSL